MFIIKFVKNFKKILLKVKYLSKTLKFKKIYINFFLIRKRHGEH